MSRFPAIALLLLVAVGCSGAGTRPRPGLQRTLDALVSEPGRIAPGAVAYVSGPHGTWIGTAGLADVVTGAPMQTDTRVRLESVSKLWVATLVVQLAEEGRLRLDDTVEHWLPGLLPYGRRITVRELLNHTSGMVDSNDIMNDAEHYIARVEDPALRARLLDVGRRLQDDPGYAFPPTLWVRFAAALPLEYPPESTFHYSNIGYVVAGLVAERAAGADLATLIHDRITEPLHLQHTAYDPAPEIGGDHAQGYRVDQHDGLTNTTTWTVGLGANGGIVSDAADEATFLRALMSGKLVGPRWLAEIKRAPFYSSYGLGTGVDDSGCAGLAYGHNGGGDGFETNVFVSGDGKRVTVLLLNGRTADDHGDPIAFDAMKALYCAA